MCGLFGWQWRKGVQPNKHDRVAIALELAKGADARGGQSWGVWSPETVLHGMSKATDQVGRFSNLPSIFGHSRYATHGTNSIENAHPFIKNGIALSHNGVLSNHWELNNKFDRKHVVDSQHLLSHMSEGKPFTDIKGYGAITWASDNDSDCIYMGRLSETGSLYVALTDKGVIWSSIEAPALAAMKAGHLKIDKSYIIEPGKCYFAEGGKLYVDQTKPSILVTTPPVVQTWESYRQRNSGGVTYPMYNAYTIGWCNLHKMRYSACECRGMPIPAHVVNVLNSATPKVGEMGVEYIPPKPTVPTNTPVSLPQTTTGIFLCVAVGCRNYQLPIGTLCAEHKAIQESKAGKVEPIQLTSAVEQPKFTSGDYWCSGTGCYELRPRNSLFCNKCGRRDEPKMLTVKAPNTVDYPWAEDMRAAWLDWAGNEPDEDTKDVMKADLAEWWFETQHGINGAAFVGMSSKEILQTAIDMGFDADAALTAAMKKEEANDPEPEITDVQSPEVKREPANGGATGTVARRAGS